MNTIAHEHLGAWRRAAFAAFVLAVYCGVSGARASIGTLDQFNSSGDSITLGFLRPGQSLGQSFRPTLSGIDLFDILALSRGNSTVQLNLFAGHTNRGLPIASSPITTITNTSMETIEFKFPTTVSLLPETEYTARIDFISGDSYRLQFSNLNPYSRGLAFNELGDFSPTADLVFAEGLISTVPEPSSALLTGAAFLLLLSKRTI